MNVKRFGGKQKEIPYKNSFARTESVCTISDGLSLRIKSISLMRQKNFVWHFASPGYRSPSFFFFFAFSPTAGHGPRLEFYLHTNKVQESFSYQ